MENSEEEFNYFSFTDLKTLQNNFSKTNTLQKIFDDLSLKNERISSIHIISDTSGRISTLKNSREAIKENLFPYPDEDEIPQVIIKDENTFKNGDKIIFYNNFDDDKFNKCKKCKNNSNKYFCEKCLKNNCDICYKDCFDKKHSIINLKDKTDEVKIYIKEIRNIIFKNIIEPEKKEKKSDSGIEKKETNYIIIDEDKINSFIGKSVMDYTNDILLIESIIEKNYNNYFHYKNIEECYNYIKIKYGMEKNEEKKEDLLFKIYEEKLKNSILIKYKINNDEKIIKVFGFLFVKNNKNKCRIFFDNKIYQLSVYFNIENYKNKNNILEIKLIGINNINNASYMFRGCSSLIALPDISNWNITNVTDISGMFESCSSLEYLPDISKWNTSNIINMNGTFENCSSLKSLPDISNWNTSNVLNISSIFENCSSLESLPDISKWNINNVIKNNFMFHGCSNSLNIPQNFKNEKETENNFLIEPKNELI